MISSPVTFELLPETITEKGITIKGISFGPWTLVTQKGRICDSLEMAQVALPIPYPEMFFGHNRLVLKHQNGYQIEFCALDALKEVDATDRYLDLQVACSDDWKRSRYVYCVIEI